jgi:hypothetical protein
MDERTIVARDARVSAMLTNPELYFSDARRRAWVRAVADVAADLDRRARARRNGRTHPADAAGSIWGR